MNEPILPLKERMKLDRQLMPEQDAVRRGANFLEVNLGFTEKMALLEAQKEKKTERPPPAARRVAEAFASKKNKPSQPKDEPPVTDMTMTVSEQERLQQMDFEAMGATEIAEAKREIRRLVLPLDLRRTRRRRPDPTGPHVDLRATIRQSRLT